MSNRLAQESSPYLQQHAGNPVDWYPWGPEALERAVSEDRPILLSVGYSSCHWCHVMERESFEDPTIAALMNKLYVNIKVDREERPDIDQIYMKAVQAMTGRGGWPMTVFLTPEGIPFFGGTYYPPEPQPGMPSLPQILESVADAWANRREDVLRGGEKLLDALRKTATSASESKVGPEVFQEAWRVLANRYDATYGG
ncbi:MAG: thioredoxin domain-containing protein, partial [Longimicrobiales bacterium]